jgi:glycosyltransferase involved in cell wall biosynthesis
MKVALVAPAFGQTGGPEVVVQNLAQAFSENQTDFTLFAPGDWKTDYPYTPTIPQSLWDMENFSEQSEWERRNLIFGSQTAVLRYQEDFSLIHLHSQRSAYAVAIGARVPTVVTLHSRIDQADFEQMKSVGIYMVGLTRSQVGSLPVDAIIGNGLPLNSIQPSFGSGEYLLAVGRLNMQKGIHQAIQIAKKAGKKLIIIGRVGLSDDRQDYFETHIKPFIDGEQIVLIESVAREKIGEYFRNASFLIHSITALESHSLVMMEALAHGTPVLGTMVPPLPEIFSVPNNNAFLLSDDLDLLAAAASHPERFSRKAAREYAEHHFDSQVMAKKYLALYEKILSSQP